MRFAATLLITCFFIVNLAANVVTSSSEATTATHWAFRDQTLKNLVAQIPKILETQDPATGQWGNKNAIWIVTDQHPMWPLAMAWATEHPDNPYYHSTEVLDAITSAGDALIADAGNKGEWEFRKKDGSTWGPIRMPWTYTRWIRTYQQVRDAMPAEKQKEWDEALTLGYTHIAESDMNHLHNIPVYHAVGLYCAGQVFDREDWREQARKMMHRVVETQTDGGYWSENHGPVVGYGSVYVEALGIYYTMSKDESVLPAIDRAARFFTEFTYPDGSSAVEIDERQTYKSSITTPPSTFFITKAGRTYAKRQWDLREKKNLSWLPHPDMFASVLAGGIEGPVEPARSMDEAHSYLMPDGKALIAREKGWALCFSAYACPVPDSRWIQDRQNLVGLFHTRKGLLMGGGNTKLTPLWSTFTVGDISLLKHKEGDSNPDFLPRPGLLHVPTTGKIDPAKHRMDLVYGEMKAHVQSEFIDNKTARITYAVDQATTLPVKAHMPLMPRLKKAWSTAAGKTGKLSDSELVLSAEDIGAWFELDGVRYTLPHGSTVTWPVLMHNPYAKYGETTPAKGGRLTITIPFGLETGEKIVEVGVRD